MILTIKDLSSFANPNKDFVLRWIEEEEWNTKLPRKRVPLYLRFGLFSRRERSFNWAIGEYERGISVYPAKLIDGIVYLDDKRLWSRADDSDLLGGRIVFVLSGKESIHTGSDGEPLLQPSSIRLLAYTVAFERIRDICLSDKKETN